MTTSAYNYNFPRDLFLGFDSLFDNLYQFNDNQQSKQTYPPYNVVKKDDTHYLIEIAVAGFKSEDIDLILEKGVLTVDGKQERDDKSEYIR